MLSPMTEGELESCLLPVVGYHLQKIVHAFLSSAVFFSKIKLLSKNYFRNTIRVKQFGSRSGPTFCQASNNILSGLIWVHTVCNGYQQMTSKMIWSIVYSEQLEVRISKQLFVPMYLCPYVFMPLCVYVPMCLCPLSGL